MGFGTHQVADLKRDILTPLKEEHNDITERLVSARKVIVQAPSSEELTEMIDDLSARILKHFNHEERILYKPLVMILKKDSPTDEMMRQHELIRRGFELLRHACDKYEANHSSVLVLRRQFDSLQRRLNDHMKREEGVLFWLADFKLN